MSIKIKESMKLIWLVITLLIFSFCKGNSRPTGVPQKALYVKETDGYVLTKRNPGGSIQIWMWDAEGVLFAESHLKDGIDETTFYKKNGMIKYKTRGAYGDAYHQKISIENN